MKILYGIAGTGNGHLSRSHFIYNLLTKYSDIVDVLISGDNYSLKPTIPIAYYNKGVTFSVHNGKINYLKTLSNGFFSSISLTIDEPTTTPSAISATFFASSGVFIPTPTQIGIFV